MTGAHIVIRGKVDATQAGGLKKPLWRRAVLILAAFGFGLGIFLSYRAQPDAFTDLNFGPLIVLALFTIPATVLLNALEFRGSAQLIGHDIGLAQAAEITIVGSVANMLPIPGGTMVRIAALKAAGASLKRGTAATLLVSLLWISVSFIYSGVWLAVLGLTGWFVLGAAFICVGLVSLIICAALCFKLSEDMTVVINLLSFKVGLVLLDATRLYLCFRVLGLDGTFAQSSVLTVSSVLGAAVSIVPAGLGIREGVAALLAPFVDLPAASAYVATSINRVVGLTVMAPVAFYLGLRSSRQDATLT